MSKSKTKLFDPADYLDDSESIATYLSDALESEDPAFVADALGVVARARGMSAVAREAGVSRESLYRALSADGNPEFATVLRVVRALGLRLSAATMGSGTTRANATQM
jgi:probable addiction module antidote protein